MARQEKNIYLRKVDFGRRKKQVHAREKDRKKKEIIDEKENGRIKRSRRMETKG